MPEGSRATTAQFFKQAKFLTVVILGRPNVGKSTLFNRLVGSRKALVHDVPGVTRDRIEKETAWFVPGNEPDRVPIRVPIRLVDTGGIGGETFAAEIFAQIRIALAEADAALVVFDGKAGLLPEDKELLRELNQSGLIAKIPLLGVVNKVDENMHEDRISDFYAAGVSGLHGELFTVSAEHGRGIDELKFATVAAVKEKVPNRVEAVTSGHDDSSEEPEDLPHEGLQPEDLKPEGLKAEMLDIGSHIPRIAIVGRPNVGKSTLINALIGHSRMITSPIAGTTTDAVDTAVELNEKPYILIDTAGIRRKNKTEKGVEVLSVVQSRKAIERADVAVLVLDGETGVSDQDEKIGGLIEEAGCSVILLINKWDVQRDNIKFTKKLAAERIRAKMGYLGYAPMLFASAKENEGLEDLGDLVEEILTQREVKISTKELSDWVKNEATVHNPKNAKFYMSHQSGRYPPTFVSHVNDPEKIDFSLKRHLINALRARWGYMGTPIRFLFVGQKKLKK